MTRCLFFALLGAASGVVLPPPRVEGNPPRVERRSWAIWALLASRRAQHKRQYLLAATATPRLRHVTTDAEGAFAVHDFDIGGNVTYECSHDAVRWVWARRREQLSGHKRNAVHLVIACPVGTRAVRVMRLPSSGDRPDPVDDVVIFDAKAPHKPPPRQLTACVPPLFSTLPDTLRLYMAYYSAVGVDRFVIFDANDEHPELASHPAVDYHPWGAVRALIQPGNAASFPGHGIAMSYCLIRYASDAKMLLGFDLDEYLSCRAGPAWRPGFRDIRAALGQATSKPCACLSRNLYDRPLGGGSLPDTVIAQQHNRKCVVTPTAVDDANVHQTRCRGRREEIEDTVCWINHYRNARGLR
mmetsp:Transcript_34406/g.105723  ORF Transcript_34406/g.105723 Transcript_34406/m.105723 type:complete len:356 (-) Transcript_34406:36-1103(-)